MPNKGESKSQSSSRETKSQMTKEDSARIQSNADKNRQSPTAKSGFKERAQSAAEKNAK